MVSGLSLTTLTSRDTLGFPTISEVISSPLMPARARHSASAVVATQTPRAHAFTWRLAISAHLCVLACGRRPMEWLRACSLILRMLASNRSRSSNRHGVDRSAFDTPSVIPLSRIIVATSASEYPFDFPSKSTGPAPVSTVFKNFLLRDPIKRPVSKLDRLRKLQKKEPPMNTDERR